MIFQCEPSSGLPKTRLGERTKTTSYISAAAPDKKNIRYNDSYHEHMLPLLPLSRFLNFVYFYVEL